MPDEALAPPLAGRQRLFVHRYGQAGPPVVLLHGLGASGRLWRPVAEQLTVKARLLCPDLLGFGRSPKPSVAYSVADHLQALDCTLDDLLPAGEPVLLGGTSGGAVLALAWAAARSERFSWGGAQCPAGLPLRGRGPDGDCRYWCLRPSDREPPRPRRTHLRCDVRRAAGLADPDAAVHAGCARGHRARHGLAHLGVV